MKRISGHGAFSIEQQLQEQLEFVRQNNVRPDRYGRGAFKQSFEKEVAEDLGYEAALFMPSGVMAQLIACRIYADTRGFDEVAMHATSHLLLHEEEAYRVLHSLNAIVLGEEHRVVCASDLQGLRDKTVVLEIPARHLGAAHIEFDELEKIKEMARENNLALHIDGARLWEACNYYQKPLKEICRGTSSCYVSFYKGLGSTSGAMLLGEASFIEAARIGLRQHGGDLFELWPLLLPAFINYQKRKDRFDEYFRHAQRVTEIINSFDNLQVSPWPLQTNMFHVLLSFPRETIENAIKSVEEQTGLDATGGLWEPFTTQASVHRMEIYIGEAAASWSDEEIRNCYKIFSEALEKGTRS